MLADANLCGCGCGKETAIAKQTFRREGILVGEHRSFIKGHHLRIMSCWKNGTIQNKGYIYMYAADHPHPTQGKYVKRARLVMEKHLGRYLLRSEQVHHKNGIRDDDRLENLEVMTLAEHNREHDKTGKMLKARWPK